MIDKSHIDPNALAYYRMLKEAGFSAYFVGGSVRDLLLGKTPKDFDIATNATPHQIKRIIPYGRIIGRRFRHVMLERDGGRYEIVTFRGPIVQSEQAEASELEEPIDENTEAQELPDDSASEENANGAPRPYADLNQFGNAEQDAKRRDFTINALFYDPDVDELVDYVEGKQDIDRHTVRTIGDPFLRMEEDPIRILRAIRHKTKLGLTYDAALKDAMIEKASHLENTSKDRIREEFLKVCMDHSLGAFLNEAKELGILHFFAPWFKDIPEDDWQTAAKLWQKFLEEPTPAGERSYADMGLGLMFTAMVRTEILEPYRVSHPVDETNYLPDMKYFLSCEKLRNFMLRNLRISRAQTDHLLRALFYWSRMTGLWAENGPPRRIVGRLFQHAPALLAAKMARITFTVEGKPDQDWVAELADFDPNARRPKRHQQKFEDREDRPERQERNRDSDQEPSQEEEFSQEERAPTHHSDEAPEAEEFIPKKSSALPAPTEPMIWNGPLHAPVLRPTFSEETTVRWARRNQTVQAYRPSGIPNTPKDHAMLKSHLVTNYKPEMETSVREEDEQQEHRRSSGPRQHRRDHRNDRGERG